MHANARSLEHGFGHRLPNGIWIVDTKERQGSVIGGERLVTGETVMSQTPGADSAVT